MTTPIVDPFLAANEVARNFSNLFAALRASMVQQLFAMWFGLDSYRDASLDGWLHLSLPLVQAAQETSSTATATYIQMQLELMGLDGQVNLPPFDVVTGAAIRNGVPPEEVYARPFKDVWTALSKGKDYQTAIEEGANRLRQLVETDIQLSHTHSARQILSGNRGVVGFRRVPTGAFTCALCMVASTQRYHSYDLMPIHPGCDCRVAPIVGSARVPQVLDKELLNRIHEAIKEQFGMSDRAARSIDYRKIALVENHGEYGPTLTVAKHSFTGPNDLAPSA